jgi:hypothetical protein
MINLGLGQSTKGEKSNKVSGGETATMDFTRLSLIPVDKE